MIAAPPLVAGAVQLIVTSPLPGVALRLRGTPGAVAVLASTLAATPGPTLFKALTLKVIFVLLGKPVNV